MNFYKRYVGDYQRDTGHLSIAEHGAYTLMLDAHYGNEKPLPADKTNIYRLVRAMTKPEQLAVDSVLGQFWMLTNEGWINGRASDEIEKAAAQSATNRRIAEQREQKRKGNESSTNRTTNRGTNGEPNQTTRLPDTRNQTPDTRSRHQTGSQTSERSSQPGSSENPESAQRTRKRKTPLPDDFALTDRLRDWAKAKGFDRLDDHFEHFTEKAKAKGYEYVDWEAAFMGAVRKDWAGLRSNGSGKLTGDALTQHNAKVLRDWAEEGSDDATGRTD